MYLQKNSNITAIPRERIKKTLEKVPQLQNKIASEFNDNSNGDQPWNGIKSSTTNLVFAETHTHKYIITGVSVGRRGLDLRQRFENREMRSSEGNWREEKWASLELVNGDVSATIRTAAVVEIAIFSALYCLALFQRENGNKQEEGNEYWRFKQ